MRAHVTARRPIEAARGQSEANVQSERPFLFGVNGELHSLRLQKIIHGFRYSILPALSLDGILAVDIIENSFTAVKFAHFVDGLLDRMNDFPGPNSVIVMDNCRVHKANAILDMIKQRLDIPW